MSMTGLGTMARPLRAHQWHDSEPAEVVDRPAIPSLDREPWRALQSSLRIRFIGERGGELDAARVDPQARCELLSALEARHMLGSVYGTLKQRGFAGVTKDQRTTLDLLVFGFIDVRHLKTGEFRLDFRSSGRKGRFNVQELYSKAFELTRLV